MDRLTSFSPAVQTTMIHLVDPSLSLAALGRRFGISKQAARKRIDCGMRLLRERTSNEQIESYKEELRCLKEELAKRDSLIARLRRQLCLQTAIIFMHNCFKERVQRFFPVFDLKRFAPYEKKHLLDILAKFQKAGGSLRDYCKGIEKSEETISRWLEAYKKYGLAGLKDKTTRPKNFSNRMPLWLKEQLLILFLRFPEWSAYQYHRYIKNNPATNYAISIGAIEKLKSTVVRQKQAEKERIKKRWAFAQNLSVWTVDFTCIIKTDGYKLQLLTVSDQRSRFWFESVLLLETSTQQITDHLEELFLKYGRPFMIKADNGPEFKMECRSKLNDLGTYLFNSPTYYGQFCGAHERIHRSLKNYISDFSTHKNLSRLVEEIKKFTDEYNHEWTFDYLENRTPAEVFYSDEDFVPKDVEVITPYEKDGQLRMKFTNREKNPARMSLPLLDKPSTT